MKRILATHKGPFHADDLFAYAVIGELYQHHTLVRTRDPKTLASAFIVFDVGGIYDHQLNRYDHHFSPLPARPDHGYPYCSFGLIWKHYGMSYLRKLFPETHILLLTKVHAAVDLDFVRQIDISDNGKGPTPRGTDASSFLEAFNPSFTVTQEQEDATFVQTSKLAGTILREVCGFALRSQRAIKLFKAQARKLSEQILCFKADSRSDAWLSCMDEPEFADVKFVLHPDGEGDWRCRTIPKKGKPFEPRIPFPKAWAGKKDAQLQAITGVETAIFCHPRCYIAGAKTKKDALLMAEKALAA